MSKHLNSVLALFGAAALAPSCKMAVAQFLSGEVGAELSGLAKRLADLGVSGAPRWALR
jgi:hypothetical protein